MGARSGSPNWRNPGPNSLFLSLVSGREVHVGDSSVISWAGHDIISNALQDSGASAAISLGSPTRAEDAK
jgi:hypothetical protein